MADVQAQSGVEMDSRALAHPCPCCGNLTLDDAPPGTFEICPVCYWEDDEFQYRNPQTPGGANKMSLDEARKNYRALGACSEDFVSQVRAPRSEELPGSVKGSSESQRSK